jgi:hypothetical protein
MQKDGEVLVTGDFIYRIINCHVPWRAGRVMSLSEEATKMLLNHCFGMHQVPNLSKPHVVPLMVAENAYHAKEIIELADGKVNPSTYFHYAFACPTDIISKIGGYDEDYKTYGWEDADLYCRLFMNGIHLIPDYECIAIHPWHPKASDCTPEQLLEMRQLFVTKSPGDFFRNKMREWGQGV